MSPTPGVQEARKKLETEIYGAMPYFPYDDDDASELYREARAQLEECMKLADALALAAHCEACPTQHNAERTKILHCGDGWYCPQAEAIRSMK